MPEKRQHKKPEAIWLFDYPSLLAMDDCPKYVVSLSERDINIIWQAVLNIDKFRSRVFTERQGEYYTIVDLDQWGNFREWVSTMNVNMGDFMTCSTALEQIAEALNILANKPCCATGGAGSGVFNAGSRGAGITPQPISTYDEEDGTEIPPNGFDTWAEYRTHKCNASADVVLNFKVDLLSLSNLIPEESTFTAILAGLVGVLLTPIPYDDLAYLVGLLTVGAFEYSFLAELSAEIEDDAQSLICALYNSTDATDAQSNFRSEVDAIIDGMDILELAKDWLKEVTVSLTPNDVFNRIFTPGSTTSQDTDCSECTPVGIVIYRGRGTNLTFSGGEYSIDSTTPDAFARIAFGMSPIEAQTCFKITSVELTGYQAYAPGPVISIWYAGDPDYTVLPAGATAGDIETALLNQEVVDVDLAEGSSDQPFSITFTIDDCS